MADTKIARYQIGNSVHYGILDGQNIHRLDASPFDKEISISSTIDSLSSAKLLCPVENPRIFAVGMNYKGHIEEAGADTPEFPQMFMMPTTCAIGPNDVVELPIEAQTVHHEAELAIVIGKKGRRITVQEASDYILGYTCANDVSERVIQNKEMALGCLLIGKGFDTFCPIGPVIACGIESNNLSVKAMVNDEIRQNGNTDDLLFDVPFIVSYLSSAITLLPGDVILTGTPSGVGDLSDGDICTIEIEGIGKLVNPIRSEVGNQNPS